MMNNPLKVGSQIFFANKDDMNFKPLNIIKGSAKLCIEEEWEPAVKLNPTNFSYSFNIRSKNLKWLFWQIQPDNLKYPTKYRKRKWRVKKKWFNRYEKPRLIGCIVKATNIDSQQHLIGKVIVDTKLRKAGGHKAIYDHITLC